MKKLISLLIVLLNPMINGFSQDENNIIKTALLIVDIQDFYFPGEGPGLVNAEPASENAKEILQIFRENQKLVVHVRHKASKGFEIQKNVLPLPSEKVITKQEVNSFNGTDLLEFLQGNGINRLVIIGMQTHMCLEAAVRAAHDYGFECMVVEDACATRDLTFNDRVVKAEDVHASTLATLTLGGYAKVFPTEKFLVNWREIIAVN
jgi:nicotinamidase-related amidase